VQDIVALPPCGTGSASARGEKCATQKMVRPQKQQKVMELHAPQTGKIDDTDKSVIGKQIPNNEFRM